MHRQPLLDLLNKYDEAWPEERPTTERIRKLVTEHEDCFERQCRPGHITASAWVTNASSDRFLLVHHRKLGKWLQPGGHADGQTDTVAVARREVIEETGVDRLKLIGDVPLDLDVHPIPERRSAADELIDGAHEHHDVRFLFVANPADPLVLSDESHEVRWCTSEELEQRTTEPSVLRLRDKARLLLCPAG